MWARAVELLEQSDRLHRQFFHLGRSTARGPSWEPPVDLFESDRDLTIIVALPGVSPAQVEVVVDGGVLYVIGERPLPVAAGAVIRRLEIPYGRFERRINEITEMERLTEERFRQEWVTFKADDQKRDKSDDILRITDSKRQIRRHEKKVERENAGEHRQKRWSTSQENRRDDHRRHV